MIKGLHCSSSWLYTQNQPVSVYVGNQQSAGMLRFNTQTQQMEVYDGMNWMQFGGTATIGFTPEAEEVMQWAKKKMAEDQDLDRLLKKYPSLRELHEQFLVMRTLVTESESSHP
jgi:hypothetical protein